MVGLLATSRDSLPVLYRAPVSMTVYEGQTAKLRTGARGRSVRYQWQVNSGSGWSNIGGATSANYTTAATVRSTDSGKLYRCVVSNSAGRVIAGPITLTVWSPLDLGSNLACWLDPSQGIFTERTGASATTAVTTDGTAVGTWRARNGTINGTCSADARRPVYRPTGLNGMPGIEFDGTDDVFNFTTNLAATFNNKSYGYIFFGVQTTNEAVAHDVVMFYKDTVSARASLRFNFAGTAGTMGMTGRRLNADTPIDVTSASATIDSEVVVAGAEFIWATSEVHLRKNKIRITSDTAWQTDGATTAGDSLGVFIGASTDAGNNNFDGILGHVVICNAQLTDVDIGHIESFIQSKQGQPTFDWNRNARATGTLSLATIKSTATVSVSSATTPSEGAIQHDRYKLHSDIIRHKGRIHVAFACGHTHEDAGGQRIAYSYSDDYGVTFSTPVELVPSQSDYTNGGTAWPGWDNGEHICSLRGFFVVDGDLYFSCGIDLCSGDPPNWKGVTGVALLARKVNDDATFGTLVRISEADYTALDSKPKASYDATLAAKLLTRVDVRGGWGGSYTGFPASTWRQFLYNGATAFAETFTTQATQEDPEQVFKVARDITDNTAILWVSDSEDSGTTFGTLRKTNVPNGPSSCPVLKLTDGRFALCGDFDNTRTELWLGIFNETTRVVEQAVYIRRYSTAAVYPGTGKNTGVMYPAMCQIGNYLMIVASLSKEIIEVYRVLIPGMDDNANHT